MTSAKQITAIGVLAIGMTGASLGAGAEAQVRLANGSQFGNWTVSCEAVGVNETICVLSQRLVASSGQQFLAEFLAFADPDEPGAYVAARVPLGVHFPAGFALREEAGAEQIAFEWQSCSTELCEALIRFDPEGLQEIDAAESVIAGYLPQIGVEPLVFRVGIAGIREGLIALAQATGAPDPSVPAAE
jgi:invasion protein IalB